MVDLQFRPCTVDCKFKGEVKEGDDMQAPHPFLPVVTDDSVLRAWWGAQPQLSVAEYSLHSFI
jgi:hypothetical protein